MRKILVFIIAGLAIILLGSFYCYLWFQEYARYQIMKDLIWACPSPVDTLLPCFIVLFLASACGIIGSCHPFLKE